MYLHELITANQKTLADAEQMLLDISDETYTRVIEPFKAPVGKHMRHITDHCVQLLQGCPKNSVDYDARARDELVERNKSAMINLIHLISEQLETFSDSKDKDISVTLSVDENAATPAVKSSLARELVFLQSHTTHHCAIISAMLKLQGVFVPDDFGIAPSTLKYDQQQCAH